MKTRAYITIEYIPEGPDDPEIEPAIIEFDECSLKSHRDIHYERDAEGNFVRLIPDPTTTTVFTGTKTETETEVR